MAKTTRVAVPNNVEELLNLARLIFEQHRSLGEKSPLSPLDWDNLGKNVGTALEFHLEAEALKRQMELKYRERDALLTPLDELVRQSRDLLKAIYKKEPKKLGDFGFSVDDTPRIKKIPPTSTES